MTITPDLPHSFTNEQRQLLLALQERDRRYSSQFSKMYLGALCALYGTNNPEKLQHTAHSMREILEKLPLRYDGALRQSQGAKASDYMQTIAYEYNLAQKTSPHYDRLTNQWNGEIDSNLKRFLISTEGITDKYVSNPTRRDVNRQLLRHLSLEPLSTEKENELLDELSKYHSYFNRVAHHDTDAEENTFREMMQGCTNILLDQLKSPTTEILERLDQIIAEAEK